MALPTTFLTQQEVDLGREFFTNGWVIRDVCDRGLLDEMRGEIAKLACGHLGIPVPQDVGAFMDTIHERVLPENLNAMRLHIFRGMNDHPWLRPTYYALGKRQIDTLVGNELAMQNRVNVSIQMPEDNSSLLDIHADVYGGETPFQVVQWLPLVDVFETKSMFILPEEKTAKISPHLKDIGSGGMAALFERTRPDLIWLDIPYGKVLHFASHCLHGNIINQTKTTRWSMNSRFKGLFTPYTGAEKKLGSYYLPITTRAASRVGMRYQQPGGFEE